VAAFPPIERVAFSWRQPTPLNLCALASLPRAPINVGERMIGRWLVNLEVRVSLSPPSYSSKQVPFIGLSIGHSKPKQ
jgi:hypothetical protein